MSALDRLTKTQISDFKLASCLFNTCLSFNCLHLRAFLSMHDICNQTAINSVKFTMGSPSLNPYNQSQQILPGQDLDVSCTCVRECLCVCEFTLTEGEIFNPIFRKASGGGIGRHLSLQDSMFVLGVLQTNWLLSHSEK